jgi:hypothetical protein
VACDLVKFTKVVLDGFGFLTVLVVSGTNLVVIRKLDTINVLFFELEFSEGQRPIFGRYLGAWSMSLFSSTAFATDSKGMISGREAKVVEEKKCEGKILLRQNGRV